VRIYRTHLDWFDRWYLRNGRSVKRSVSELRQVMQGVAGDSAFTRFERALADSAGLGGR